MGRHTPVEPPRRAAAHPPTTTDRRFYRVGWHSTALQCRRLAWVTASVGRNVCQCLDDANVSRFCDLLDEISRNSATRFLLVTHHPLTMARMDRLFGVTMSERGVSQLVSVDLHAAEGLKATG